MTENKKHNGLQSSQIPSKFHNDAYPCFPSENQKQPYPLGQEAFDLSHMVLFP